MASKWSLTIVSPALILIRLGLILSPLSAILRDDHQLASPLTSFTRLKEGVFLFQNGVDPYHGGVFRHSPLTLTLFSTIIQPSPLVAAVVWTVADGIAAWCLVEIWRNRIRGATEGSREGLLAVLYLLNPYILLPTVALSTSTLDNALVLAALRFAFLGKSSAALLILAVASQGSLPVILLACPTIMLLLTSVAQTSGVVESSPYRLRPALQLTSELLVYLFGLSLISTFVAGNLNWVAQTWGASIFLPDLTPNPGLWWYFFTEMFDHFRPFFLMAFSMHLAIYVAPICIKFQHDPLYAFFLIQGVISTFKSYPTLSDSGLFVTMLALFPEIYPYLRHPLPSALLHLQSAVLLPLFHHLWLKQGTGNANFFYASTLVFGLANGATVVDCVWAGLRMTLGDKEGWEVIQL